MKTNQLVTKSETQNIYLTLMNADGTIRSQGSYWTREEAIASARRAGGFYEIRNADTRELIEAQW